ncbi:MAG: CPBP family intramembrane metalloprotease [Candidatus Lokiarchaeota archaeon]|nr:CPBP family intramembrane metalloprotease [Candidatus Lokiarchaeota archaeon]
MVQIQHEQLEARRRKPSGLVDRFRSHVRAVNPLLEALIVYGLIFCIGWTWIPAAYVAGSPPLYFAGWAVIAFLLIWVVFLSHATRGRGLEALGFASYRSFVANVKKVREWGDKWNYMLIYGTVVAAYAIFMLTFVPFTGLIPVFGTLNQFLVEHVPHSAFTFSLATAQFVFFAIITALFFFKTGNIKPSLKQHAKYGTPFVLFMFTWALLASERANTEPFMNVVAHFLGYIYWALAQQVATLVYLLPSAMEGLERGGIVRDPRRRKVVSSIITAALFAFIHIPAMPLSLIAFAAELIIAMIYSTEKYRNVFAACLLHALVGVIVVLLMQIDVTVGFLAYIG